MRFVLLHYHILKNAGSTIEDILDQSFGGRFARFDREARDATITSGELLSFVESQPELTTVSSHHIRYPLPEAAGILFFDICFLRDPIDRVRSMYGYYRQRPDPGDPVSDLANAMDLAGFVSGMVRDFPLQIRDVQVNLIAAAGDSDEPDEGHLELATSRMTRASFPGVVDIFDESATAGQFFLRQVFPELNCSLPPVNVSTGLSGTVASRSAELRSQCDPAVFAELLRLNALDFQLLERTRAEIRRRVSLIPRAAPPEPRVSHEMLFDASYYLRANPDVAAARMDPWRHYLKHGALEGRKPHPWFQPDFYLKQCPDAGNPLLHFLADGRANPHRLFNSAAYLREHPAVLNPLVDYMKKAPAPGAGIVIDDVVLEASVIKNPPTHLRGFLQAVNSDQLAAQFRLQSVNLE